jgi:hypothetical protein
MLVSQIIDRAARTFQDAAKRLITDDEWLDYVREWLQDYASRTEQFRARMRLQRGQNPWLYQLPTNTISLLWVAYDDEALEITSFRDLQEQDREYASRTGTPTHAYMDMSSLTEMRLYPAPVFEEDTLTQFTIIDADWDPATEDIPTHSSDGDTGTIKMISDSDNTYRFVRPLPRGGVIEYAEADEVGHIVAIFRTDNPASQPAMAMAAAQGGKSGGGSLPDGTVIGRTTLQMDNNRGKIAQITTSAVEIAYSYIPELPLSSDDALATEIPLQDYNELCGSDFLLNRAYQKSIETGDDRKAEYYRQLYEERVAYGIRKKSDSWASRKRRVTARYI